jgi:hypothetical protein
MPRASRTLGKKESHGTRTSYGLNKRKGPPESACRRKPFPEARDALSVPGKVILYPDT